MAVLLFSDATTTTEQQEVRDGEVENICKLDRAFRWNFRSERFASCPRSLSPSRPSLLHERFPRRRDSCWNLAVKQTFANNVPPPRRPAAAGASHRPRTGPTRTGPPPTGRQRTIIPSLSSPPSLPGPPATASPLLSPPGTGTSAVAPSLLPKPSSATRGHRRYRRR